MVKGDIELLRMEMRSGTAAIRIEMYEHLVYVALAFQAVLIVGAVMLLSLR